MLRDFPESSNMLPEGSLSCMLNNGNFQEIVLIVLIVRHLPWETSGADATD
jgi:hypothetical protein